MTGLADIEFLRPLALLLLPLPFLIWRASAAPIATNSLVVPERFLAFLKRYAPPRRQGKPQSGLRIFLSALGWTALVLALGGPIGGKTPLPDATGRDLLVVLDLSASMRAQDVRLGNEVVSRVEAVKTLAGAFIRGRNGDRVGLIAFANDPYLIAPLTYDVAAVSRFLEELSVGLPGQKTAIGDALALGVQQLNQDPGKSRVLLLLTDGVSNAGSNSPLSAAQTAQAHQIRIHTIGFGGELASDSAESGSQLLTIARTTGGQYFSAPSAAALRKVYASLDALEPTRSEKAILYVQQDLTGLTLVLALSSLLLNNLIDWRAGRL